MSFHPEDLQNKLSEIERVAGSPNRYVIALSGGLDSSVLTHALAKTQGDHGKTLLAIHVDHRLDQNSAAWAEHCKEFACTLEIEYLSIRVDVDLEAGLGPEAAARTARYAAFADFLTADDWLLSAHHREDQAETLLLNLLRGSGPAGIAAIPAARRLKSGWLIRPLLNVAQQELQDYADAAGLQWINDPSNEQAKFDRNYLRHKVMPEIAKRWPDAVARLSKSASLARDATELLADLADLDIQAMGSTESRLSISGLRALSESRQRNLLRRAVQRAKLPAPSAAQLNSIVDDVIPARIDAEPIVTWTGAELRRYRDTLYLSGGLPVAEFPDDIVTLGDEISLGPQMGVLVLSDAAGPGLSRNLLAQGISLARRKGGEKIKLAGQQHTSKLKKLLQEEGVVPWMRGRLPLLLCGDRLIAVADLWMAADAIDKDGIAVQWRDRPALK